MEALFLYLLKASGLIAAFFLAYHFLLRKETFFSSNRWFLLVGLVTSVVLPLVTFTKIVWIEPVANTIDWSALPTNEVPLQETFTINWYLVFVAIYGVGISIFLLRFVIDYRELRKVLNGKTVQQQADFKLIDLSETVAPFSYFNYIVYNSEMYSTSELESILAHEKVHCEQNHSVDVLITRLFCVLFWYNPIIWWYQKAILQNLEFIADKEALKTISDTRGEAELSLARKAYQITLLKVTTHNPCVAITNPFYQSLIKKRIVMLNKNQSKKWNSWKYVVIIPAILAFLLYFQVNVIAQEKKSSTRQETSTTKDPVTVMVDKNTSDEQLKSEVARVKSEYNIALKFSKIKRNSNGEITAIKATYKDASGKKGTYQASGDKPIKPLRFFKDEEGAIGFGSPISKTIVIKKDGVASVGNDNEDADIVISEDIVEAPEAPEAPEVAEAPEPAETPEAPEAPEAPNFKKEKRIIIRKNDGGTGKVSITINGEKMEIDPEKIIADLEPSIQKSLAELDHLKIDIDAKEIKRITKNAMREARESIRKSKPEMERAQLDLQRAQPEMERAKQEMEKARAELQQARAEIEKSKAELEKLKADAKKAKK